MDFEEVLRNAVKAERANELATSPQLLLGEIILKLEALKQDLPLYIDLMNKRPMSVDSWRGSYYELAIQTESTGNYNTDEVEKDYPEYGMTIYKTKRIGKKNPTVGQFVNILKEAMGKTFTGYKGGDFLMTKNTPVWLAEYGHASFKIDDKPIDEKDYANYKNVYFVGVEERNGKAYLITKIEED